jgi:flavin reductase (DIM6/NTAB) family NADH-FMN oxidoreductase RutF
MSVNANDFKNALKLWASGVTVVTAQSAQEGPKGMTATSFASVSMEPAQVLVCLNQATDTGALVLEQQHFAINILNAEQQTVSNEFAGGSNQEQRFANVDWETGQNGSPLLSAALVSIECKLVQQVIAGTHWVIIAEVEKVICRTGEPLLYYHSSYRQLAEV